MSNLTITELCYLNLLHLELTHLLELIKNEISIQTNSTKRIKSNKQTIPESPLEIMYAFVKGFCKYRCSKFSTSEQFEELLTRFHDEENSLKATIQIFIVETYNKNNESHHIYQPEMEDAEFFAHYGNLNQIKLFSHYSTLEFWCDLMYSVIKTATK